MSKILITFVKIPYNRKLYDRNMILWLLATTLSSTTFPMVSRWQRRHKRLFVTHMSKAHQNTEGQRKEQAPTAICYFCHFTGIALCPSRKFNFCHSPKRIFSSTQAATVRKSISANNKLHPLLGELSDLFLSWMESGNWVSRCRKGELKQETQSRCFSHRAHKVINFIHLAKKSWQSCKSGML